MSRYGMPVFALIALASTLASCSQGDRPVLYPVHGKVLFKGQPAVGATVMFQREDAPASNAIPYVPVGLVDQDGSFSLETEDVGSGAPAGKYKVLIQWRVKGEDNKPAPANPAKGRRGKIVPDKPDGVPDRLNGRFMRADNSQFKVEVKPDENTLQPFDVSI
jgi:hypothetical protein